MALLPLDTYTFAPVLSRDVIVTVSDADVAGVSDGPGQQRQELGDVRAARLGPVPDHHQPGRGPQRRDGESGTVHRTIFRLI